MKCPKCGFTSFDYLDSCKKCGNALTEFKAKHGLRSVLFPGLYGATPGRAPDPTLQAPSKSVPEAPPVASLVLPVADIKDATDFGFDFLEETPQDSHLAAPVLDDLSLGEGVELIPTIPLATAGIPVKTDFVPEQGGIEIDEETALNETDLFDLGSAEEGLPPLDSSAEFNFDAPDDLSGWGKPEVPGAEKPPRKPAGQEGPADPFDQRGPAMAGQFPGRVPGHQPDAGAEVEEESPLGRLLDSFESAGNVARLESGPALEALPALDLTPLAELPPPLPARPTPPPELVPTPDPSAAGDDQPAADGLDGEPVKVPGPVVHRLAAAMTDGLLLGAVFFAFLVTGEWLLVSGPTAALLPTTETLLLLSTPFFLIFFALGFGYFTLFHSLLGQTPGKMFFNLAVEGLDGSPLTLAQTFLRSAGGLASLCLGGAGFVVILFHRDGRGWNDRLAGSRVVIRTRNGSN